MNLRLLIIPIILLMSLLTLASGGEGGPGETIIHHVVDAQEWKPLPYVPAIPLPVFKIGNFTLPVTKHVIMMWITSLLLTVSLILAFRRQSIIPGGITSILEPIALFVRNDIVFSIMGGEMGEKWWPFFASIFFFVLGCNMLGLIPLFATATGNLSITAGLALVILFLIFFAGIKSLGPIGFFKNMIPSGVPWPLVIIIFPIEVLGLFIKAFSLSLRLFANMMAGHIVIVSLLALIFIMHPLAFMLSVPFALFIYLLEIIVALIQALVFTLLSCIFISMACSHH